MIRKNEIPILEYDDSSTEVIAPNHGLLMAFLGRQKTW